MAVGTDVLAALADHDELTNHQIAELSGGCPNSIGKALCALHRNELVERVATGHYRITQAGLTVLWSGGVRSGPKGARPGRPTVRRNTVRQRLWSLLRMQRKATLDDLSRLGGDYESAKKYLQYLASSGYVERLGAHRGARYLLVRDTGPLAPIANQERRACYDRNESKSYPWDQEVAA